jgi:hypothetical protein
VIMGTVADMELDLRKKKGRARWYGPAPIPPIKQTPVPNARPARRRGAIVLRDAI